MLVITVLLMGCYGGTKSDNSTATVTEYESFSEDVPKYKLEDFENIVVGESTRCDLIK